MTVREVIATAVYRVPSETRDGTTYNVAYARGEAVCDCPAGRRNMNCKHRKEVLKMTTETKSEEAALVPIKVVPHTAILPTKAEMSVMAMLSKGLRLASGVAVPKQLDTAGKVLAVVQAGWEMGVRPMTAMRHIAIVNGRTEPDAQLMMGIVMAAEPDAKFIVEELTPEKAVIRFLRPQRGLNVEHTYTIAEAKSAGLLEKGGPWRSFPKDMLRWAAIKRLCRTYAPDLINSIAPIRVAEAAATLATIEDDPLEDDEIDAEFTALYNEGDEPEPEPEPVQQPAKTRLGLWLVERRRELGIAQFKNIVDGINQAYPGALTASGETVISGNGALDDATAQRILDGLASDAPEGQAAFDA